MDMGGDAVGEELKISSMSIIWDSNSGRETKGLRVTAVGSFVAKVRDTCEFEATRDRGLDGFSEMGLKRHVGFGEKISELIVGVWEFWREALVKAKCCSLMLMEQEAAARYGEGLKY